MSGINEEIIYPSVDDPEFSNKLQSHPIFNQYKYEKDEYILKKMMEQSEKKCSDTGGYIYKNIQLLVSTFLSMNTPYNGLLLYHGVGVGKSCSSILIANNFKEYVKKYNKKIIILTSRAIQDGFRDEIFNTEKEIGKIDLNQFTCSSSEYSNEWNDFLNNNPDLDIKEIDKQFRENIIGEYFEIYGYQEFVNRYRKEIEINSNDYNIEKINKLFSNTVFIIDEVHNLRDNHGDGEGEISSKESKKIQLEIKGIRKIIQGIIENLESPIKLILLSATPMYDMYTEFNYIINLLLLNDKKEQLDPEIIENYIVSNDEEAYQDIINKTRGYISYIKGNDPTIFPLILYPEKNNKLYFETKSKELNYSDKINVYLCEMNTYQADLYKTYTKGRFMKEQFSNLTFPLNSLTKNLFTFDTLFTHKKHIFTPTNKEVANELLDNIEKYSIKISELLKNINACENGKIFIYTPKIKGEYAGTNFLQIILEHYGYSRKTIIREKVAIENSYDMNLNPKSPHFKGYYMVAPAVDNFSTYIANFNEKSNNYGKEIKIIIGTTNMFEGVSLSNIRQIHILEPWYNLSRNVQIIGRGVRQCSHINLKFENRNFTIFNYVAICDKNIKDKYEEHNEGYIVKYKKDSSKELDIDVRKLQIATEKTIYINKLEEILKLNSIDCYLNKNVNEINILNIDEKSDENIIEFKDYKNDSKFILFALENNINCGNIEKKENNIYNYQYKTFQNKNLIKNTCFFIKTVFKKGIDSKNVNVKNKIYYTYQQLFDETKLYNNQLDEELFKISLQELILSKETFYNKFNNLGYIIVKGQYYIFKNIDSENINIPFEFSTYPYTTKINNIKNFSDYSIEILKVPPKVNPKKTIPQSIIPQSSKEKTIQPDKNITKSEHKDIKKKNKAELLTNLYNICEETGLDMLESEDINEIYNRLHISFRTEQKNKFEALMSLNTNDFKRTSQENFYENIFKKIFKKEFKSKVFALKIDNELLDRFYNYYFILPFIFNYSEFITTHLKCIFHKKFIKKKELTDLEQNIFNHYQNLIVSEEPLIFKFIDWSGKSIHAGDTENSYNYEYLGIVFYEYYNDEWILYNKTFPKSELTIKTKSNQDIKFYKILVIASDKKSKINTNKDFIKNELYSHYPEDLQEYQWNKIYNTFDFHLYTNIDKNNGYFKYSGNPDKPFNILNDTDIFLKKLDNIIGIPSLFLIDKKTSFYKISRNIYPLTLLYTFEDESGKIVYYKNAFHCEFKEIGKKVKVKLPFKLKHIIYCILDQVEELNIKLLLEIILDKNITDLWKTNEDFKFDINNILKDINLNNPELSNDTFKLLKEFLIEFEEFEDFDFKDIKTINENLNQKKNEFYVNLPFIYDIINSNYILTTNAPEYISLITYILYDLDNLNFYNKKWIFSIFEASLLNTTALKIETVKADSIVTGNRLADTYSVTKNSFIKGKMADKNEKKYKDIDI